MELTRGEKCICLIALAFVAAVLLHSFLQPKPATLEISAVPETTPAASAAEVPTENPTEAPAEVSAAPTGEAPAENTAAPEPETAWDGQKLDLNRATQEDLEQLPGIGPVLAGRILEWRSAHGAFSKTEELLEVSGIGQGKLEKIFPYVFVKEAGHEDTGR